MKWIRKNVSWIAGAAVGGFVLWLVATAVSTSTTGPPASAGSLYGRNVSVSSYLQARRAVRHQAILRHGDRYPQKVSNEQLESQTWERLMLLEEAKQRRIRVVDEEVVRYLRTVPLFLTETGQFDRPGYETVVRYSLGTTPRAFEEEIRKNIKIQKLLHLAVGQPTVTEKEIKDAFHRREESFRVSYLVLPDEELAKEVAQASREDPTQMNQTAQELEKEITTTDFLKRSDSIDDLGLAGPLFEMAFQSEPGQVTGPINSSQGWLVVKLEEKRSASEENLEQLRQTLQDEIESRKRIRSYLSWYQALVKRANPQKPVVSGKQ